MSDEFAAPAGITGFSWEDAKNHLLVIKVRGLEPDFQTTYGKRDVVVADIYDISAKTVTEGAMVFPRLLVSSLSDRIGQRVLATLGQGVAKSGQSAPWVLTDQSKNPRAVKSAQDFLAKAEKAAKPVAAGTVPLDDDEDEIPF